MSSANDKFLGKVKVFYDQANTGDGITVSTMARVIKKAYPNFKGSDQDIAQIFLEIDENSDKMITWEEFHDALCAKNPKEVTRCELEEAFKILDTDGSGKLDRNEVKSMVQKLKINWSDEELDKAINDADPNQDGVSIDEFLSAWSS